MYKNIHLLLWATLIVDRTDPAPDLAVIAGIVHLIIARFMHTTL